MLGGSGDGSVGEYCGGCHTGYGLLEKSASGDLVHMDSMYECLLVGQSIVSNEREGVYSKSQSVNDNHYDAED